MYIATTSLPIGEVVVIKKTLAQNYLYKFRFMRYAFDRFFRRSPEEDNCPIVEDSASALWMLQISQVSYKSKTSNHVFTDSFYTRHFLARAIEEFSGGLVKMTGTFTLFFLTYFLSTTNYWYFLSTTNYLGIVRYGQAQFDR